ncbi:hypothetical protein CA54_25130 [Symmachiella macrocystis]|uniref:Uncharacterized protein n=1 Tax=Symmachiella macrocystis TaxID=2527985 RepID=A0A5C6BNR3_9PLAN|nr:hypothetical protein CA54_25130 [Symmachiella macrocystis]
MYGVTVVYFRRLSTVVVRGGTLARYSMNFMRNRIPFKGGFREALSHKDLRRGDRFGTPPINSSYVHSISSFTEGSLVCGFDFLWWTNRLMAVLIPCPPKAIICICPWEDNQRVAAIANGNRCAAGTRSSSFSCPCQRDSACVGTRELRLLAGCARPDSEAIAATRLVGSPHLRPLSQWERGERWAGITMACGC